MTRFMQQHMFRTKMELAPLAKSKRQVSDLPKVPAPNLDDFVVQVPEPPPISEVDIMAAMATIARDHGEVTVRDADEPIQPADEVLVDLVGYAAGRVVPNSARAQTWLTVDDDEVLPGLRRALDGRKAKESLHTPVRFPDDHPIEELRGQTIVYAVDVHASRLVTPANLEDETILKELEMATFEDLLEAVAEQQAEAREAMFHQHAQMAIGDALQARLPDVAIDDAVVDAELDARWNQIEGALLREKGVPIDDQTLARNAFVKDPVLRAELVHGLRVTMALAALIESQSMTITEEDLTQTLASMAPELGMTPETMRAALAADEAQHAAVGQAILLDKAWQHVLSRALVEPTS